MKDKSTYTKEETELIIKLAYNKGYVDGNNTAVRGIKNTFNKMAENCSNELMKQTIYALIKDIDVLLVTLDELNNV